MHRRAASDPRSTMVVIAIVVGMIALMLWLTPQSIRYQRQEQMCRFRLKRVAVAIQSWVIDHGRERFPEIRNPPARTPWQPGQAGSLSEVLREYLSGDDELFRPQRTGDKRVPSRTTIDETNEDYISRLRERELTCCPITGFPYWYNTTDLARHRPADLGLNQPAGIDPATATGDKSQSLLLCRCQSLADGSPPHGEGDDAHHYGAFMHAVIRQVLPEHVAEERRRLDQEEERNAGKPAAEWTVDLLQIRAQVEALERQLQTHPDGFIVTQLGVEVDRIDHD